MSLSKIYEGCVYKITNIKTNKVYIGSCVYGLRKRKNVHLFNLRNNKHHSKKLQNSFNKYGESYFIFEEIEKCSRYIIIEREQYWIDYYNSYNMGYNCTPKAGNCEGRTVTKETRTKISLSLQGRKIIRTELHNKKLAETKYKKVVQLNKEGNIIAEFLSLKEAANTLKIRPNIVSAICSGNKPRTKIYLKYKQNV